MMRNIFCFFNLVVLFFIFNHLIVFSQNKIDSTSFNDPQQIVQKLYELVSFSKNESPDWEKVKNIFDPDALIILRTSRKDFTKFSVNEFILDFQNFIDRSNALEKGFQEKILKIKTTAYNEIADVLVLYEASIIGSLRPPTIGIDSFQLVKRGNEWLIVSITNEIVRQELELPEELR